MVMYYTSNATDTQVAVRLWGQTKPRATPVLPIGGWQELTPFLESPFTVTNQPLVLGETMSFAVRPGPGCGAITPMLVDPNDGVFFPFWSFMDLDVFHLKETKIELTP
jgi:hypothetical protein